MTQGSPKDRRPDPIPFVDEHGQRAVASREEWRTAVLPAQVKMAWRSAETLHKVIVISLDLGFAEELVEAARRLDELEGGAERGAMLRAYVELESGLLEEAAATLERVIARHGRTPTALLTLAKVAAARGDGAGARRLLRECLEIEPDLEPAVAWWMALHRDEGGARRARDAMAEIAALPGAWRAHAFLGTFELELGRIAEGVRALRTAIERSGWDRFAVTMATGALTRAGHKRRVPEVLAPGYEPARHDPQAGMYLYDAYLGAGERQKAEEVLVALERTGRPELAPYLEKMRARLPG